ncbi:integrin alpha-IIb [Clupea harengus]|uniref:Integrin alpha-IIb n=1 Tax=Clupea harengus TaxID=7950 RepID=A0A6P8FCV2_CLUHA|nr:integrin alpha-IIb [Clupea harengus]
MREERRCLTGGLHLRLLLLVIAPDVHRALNINQNNVTVYSGPEGSYFGFSVDFFQITGQGVSLVVGAPQANSTQTKVEEGGEVYLCPWSADGGTCQSMEFDQKGDEEYKVADLTLKGSKSHQWFGASVRATDKYILACAPLFHWNVLNSFNESQNTPVGNCFLKDVTTGQVSVYSPCREIYVEFHYKSTRYVNDKRYCEAGFSVDITQNGTVVLGAPGSLYFQGQIFTATLEELTDIKRRPRTYTYLPSKGVGREMNAYAFQEIYSDIYSGYSVATGFLTGDNIQDYLVGFPNDRDTSGTVRIYNGRLELKKKLLGTQVAAYFGHAVAVTDINNDGREDILIGAPLFIEQLANQQQREVGQVYVHLQQVRSKFNARPDQTLTGSVPYGRFGASIAPLGDLDKDGYNDVAVGAPSFDGNGRVFIYMGRSEGLSPQHAQVLESPFPSPHTPSAFGYTLRGGTDVDDNGYPDLIVGAWGASKIAVYRTLAVVNAKAQLTLSPDVLNPEEKTCSTTRTKKSVTCFTVIMCISVSGHRIPKSLALSVELQLDKMKQALTRRTLLLHNGQPQESVTHTVQTAHPNTCFNVTAYLRAESEFKDKLSPIFISVNYTLIDTEDAILQGQTSAMAQTRIILDCGPDNICIPDLKLTASAETSRLLIGDENPALLVVEAENQGEGAYETELHISPPTSTHFQGMAAHREGFSRLNCAQRKDNGSVIVVCDLGNPMPSGQKLKAGLLFSVGNLEEVERDVTFHMQIKSKNSHNPDSDPVLLKINVTASATLEMQGASSPMEVVLPIANWEPVERPASLEQVGPYVEHVYMLRNLGPSAVNVKAVMEFPTHRQGSTLLYAFATDSENFLSCSANNASVDPDRLVRAESTVNRTTRGGHQINKREAQTDTPQNPQAQMSRETIHVNCSSEDPCVRVECEVKGLKRQGIAVVRVMARLWVNTFSERPNENYILQSNAHYQVVGMPSKIQPQELPSGQAETHTSVVWREEIKKVPVWWIVVAIASGLLLLALLSYIFWKVGFFNRNRPPCDDDDEDDDTQNLSPEQTEYADVKSPQDT